MKKLYLLRDAKSEWSNLGKSDFERGLNRRGKRSIPLMAEALRKRR